ncbi:hypothetical protein BCR41DRAFT_370190 [Lobosporangium transversale]|uniref:Uncharacterized protein n=1 Tax=Lobosporangium transversale TaxID=64571 RepID=A0A1Y2GQ27_9FUNG|nr:hypothetical protein BCR41DRAFT_370190 [Lobosporangium transversale]ORZ18399.1 hypothetical protein BCR41DRAFT_370190 [Lobosporangium transversale]|eukprot:XP_021882194.1 hypothetical protein BCR41DRAFT_370190 [Lobosporangium transversale]
MAVFLTLVGLDLKKLVHLRFDLILSLLETTKKRKRKGKRVFRMTVIFRSDWKLGNIPLKETRKEDVTRLTHRVPREFMLFIRSIEERALTRNDIDTFVAKRTSTFHAIVWTYYETRSETSKKFAKRLATVFLGNNSQSSDFEWDFRDLGLIYRLNKDGGAMNYAFTNIPHHEHILRQVNLGEVGDDFKLTLLVRFLTLTKPIVLRATNLCGKDLMEIKMDFKDHGTIQQGKTSFRHGYGHVLSHCYPTYPRFDFTLDTMFIQVFVSDFQEHDRKQTKKFQNAFAKRGSDNINKIESYLDEVLGGNHSAVIDDGHSVVKKDEETITGFIIVYMCGSSGAPNHTGLVDKHKDLLHVSFDELKEKVFRNIPT